MTAVDQLQRKINQLNRNIKITADTRVRERTERTGGGGGASTPAASIAISPTQVAAVQKTASLYADIGRVVKDTERGLRGIDKLEQQRQRVAADINDKIEQRNKAVEEQAKKIEKVKSVAFADDFVKARNAVFGGTIPGRSAAQAYQDVQQQIQGLGPKILRLNGQIAEQRAEYMKVTQAVKQLDAAERKRRLNVLNALDEIDRKNAKVARNRARRNSALRGAGVGAGAAALQIPGLSQVASGGLAGAAAGGPLGAVAGAAAAGIVSVTLALGAYAVKAGLAAQETTLLRRSLEQVVGTDDLAEALGAIESISDRFLVNIPEATKQFTRLAAAARASGFSVEETKTTYEGLAAANLALGGTSEQLQGILLATTQVFSKGKVQAEELRGQIGERLAGAFAQFAESAGKTPAELDKALEQGEVTLQEFVEFTEFLLERYGSAADKLADDPAAAGRRLSKALSDLQLEVGTLMEGLVGEFQTGMADIVNAITPAIEALNRFLGTSVEAQIARLQTRIEQLRASPFPWISEDGPGGLKDLEARLDALIARRDKVAGIPLGDKPTPNTEEETPEQRRKREADERAARRLAEQQARQAQINDLLRVDKKLKDDLYQLEVAKDRFTESQFKRLEAEAVYKADIRKIERQITDETQKQLAIYNRAADLKLELLRIDNEELEKVKQTRAELTALVNEIANQGLKTTFETDEIAEVPEAVQRAFDGANQAGNELFRTFENLISATKNWTDVLADALKALSSVLIRFALGGLANGDGQGLFSFLNGTLSPSTQTSLPGVLSNQTDFTRNLGNVGGGSIEFRARGGRVTGASPYVVGEQGAELFIPGKSGTIVPADVFNATRAAMSGGSEGGDSDAFDQNAVAIGTNSSITKEKAVTREMAMAGSTAVDVRYDATVINDVSYVSEEQFQAGLKAAVAQSKASMFRDLKNKPSARAGIGI